MTYDKPRKGETILRPIWIDVFVFNHVTSPEVVEKNASRMLTLQRLYWYAKAGMRINNGDSLILKLRCFRNDLIHKLMNLKTNIENRIYSRFYNFIVRCEREGGEYIATFESEIKKDYFFLLS